MVAKNLDNILPKNLGDIPVLVDGLLDDAAKQAGKVDDLLTDGFGNLQGTAAGLGAAADDLFKPFFESTSGKPKGYDWTHIENNHAPWGNKAKQRLKENPDYIESIFEGATSKDDIQQSIQRAWENKTKIKTQTDPFTGEVRIQYESYDSVTRKNMIIWENQTNKTIETAFPEMAKERLKRKKKLI